MKRFFFAPESPRPLALVRIGLGLVLLYEAARHWPFAVELYSDAGLPVPLFPGTLFQPPVPSAGLAVAMQSLLVFCLVLVLFGWETRIGLWGAAVLTLWLGLLDVPGTFAKFTVIAVHLLVLLGCSRCGAVWSLWSLWSGSNRGRCQLGPAWPRRLIQILVCSIYFGAGMTKLQTPEFVNGDLLTYSLLDDRWGMVDLGFPLAAHLDWVVGAGLATILFELLFPFLVWVRPLRIPMLMFAALFHLALFVTMRLGIFSPIMWVALLAFLNEGDWERIRRAFAPIAPKKRSASRGELRSDDVEGIPAIVSEFRSSTFTRRMLELGFTLACALAWSAAGYAIQYAEDSYGVFHPVARGPFPEITAADAAEILAGQRPQEADYFQRVEIGERFKGNRIFGARKEFRRGMRVYVLVQLILPHPALRVEGLLIAPDGQEVARFATQVEPAYTYAVKGFELTESLPEGRYRVIVQANGYEAAQKEFELVP